MEPLQRSLVGAAGGPEGAPQLVHNARLERQRSRRAQGVDGPEELGEPGFVFG